MKNHYISQFIIKSFSNAINVFDLKTGRIDENKRPNKVFYKKDIYSEELEKLFNFNIESKVANILKQKILVDGDVVLKRTDLEVLKRYMLICSVRSQEVKDFCRIIKKFESNANIYINIKKEYSSLKTIKEINISDDELYARTLKVFAMTKNIKDILFNPLATREMLAWAMPFLDSYFAFWDSPSDNEFILSDCAMCSEYEGFHMITGGIDISKKSYLIKQINNKKYEYADLFASNIIMYENYNFCVLSSNRIMVMINPFFNLYFNPIVYNNGTTYNLEKPDIWPAIIQDKVLFDTPQKNPVVGIPFFLPDDIFIYKPKTLNKEDIVFINNLILCQTKEIIGFNNPEKILDSVLFFIWMDSNIKSVKAVSQSDYNVIINMLNNLKNTPVNNLAKYCQSKGGVYQTNVLLLFDKLLNNVYKDFRENSYILEYFLSRPEETANCKALDFIGSGYKKLDVFKKMLKELKGDCVNVT